MYKNKRIAIVFFARSNSKRLKKKLFKKILNTDILTMNFKIVDNIKYVDDKIIATTKNKEDDKIEKIGNKNNIKVFRGSEKNVLNRFYNACKILEHPPDIIVRYCCENPLTSSYLLEKNIRTIVDRNLDLISVLKPSNIIFGIAPIILNYKTMKDIYKNANNKIYKEHIENYCYDNSKKYKIFYPILGKKYYFPDTNFSIDTPNDFKRVKNIFEKLNLKFKNYDYNKISKSFSNLKIFIDDIKLKKYCLRHYNNNYLFTKNLNVSNIVIVNSNINIKKDNKIYINIRQKYNKIIIYCIRNKKVFNLIICKKFSKFESIEYYKLFFNILINKIKYWPPIDVDDLTLQNINKKIFKKNLIDKMTEYFPTKIIANRPVKLNLPVSKVQITNKRNFLKILNNRELNNNIMFIYNDNFVYYNKGEIIKIKKYDFFQIPNVWRSYEYSKLNKEIEAI